MLVLSRKKDESIVLLVAGGIKITVLRADGGRVKLGIDAPKDVQILRSELHESNQEAVA